LAAGPAPRVISTIPYGGEKQGLKELLKELRFCGWGPAAIITTALYRDPLNPLQNQNPPPRPFVSKDPPGAPGGCILWKTTAVRKADKAPFGGGW